MTLKMPACRTDADDFFKLSGYFRKGQRWSHYPLLVFIETADGVEIQILNSVAQLTRSTLPDATQCLQQWGGQWNSDFFTFTLGEARAAASA